MRKLPRMSVTRKAFMEFLRMVTAHEDIIITMDDTNMARAKCKPARKGRINGSGDCDKKVVGHSHRVTIEFTPEFKQLLDKQKELTI